MSTKMRWVPLCGSTVSSAFDRAHVSRTAGTLGYYSEGQQPILLVLGQAMLPFSTLLQILSAALTGMIQASLHVRHLPAYCEATMSVPKNPHGPRQGHT